MNELAKLIHACHVDYAVFALERSERIETLREQHDAGLFTEANLIADEMMDKHLMLERLCSEIELVMDTTNSKSQHKELADLANEYGKTLFREAVAELVADLKDEAAESLRQAAALEEAATGGAVDLDETGRARAAALAAAVRALASI